MELELCQNQKELEVLKTKFAKVIFYIYWLLFEAIKFKLLSFMLYDYSYLFSRSLSENQIFCAHKLTSKAIRTATPNDGHRWVRTGRVPADDWVRSHRMRYAAAAHFAG